MLSAIRIRWREIHCQLRSCLWARVASLIACPARRNGSQTGTQEPGGNRPCGCIQPIKKDTTSSTNSAIDKAIRMVRNFTVRLVSPRSLIRLNMPAPRLINISANRNKIIIFMIIDIELNFEIKISAREQSTTVSRALDAGYFTRYFTR